jgi:hypothetical protein
VASEAIQAKFGPGRPETHQLFRAACGLSGALSGVGLSMWMRVCTCTMHTLCTPTRHENTGTDILRDVVREYRIGNTRTCIVYRVQSTEYTAEDRRYSIHLTCRPQACARVTCTVQALPRSLVKPCVERASCLEFVSTSTTLCSPRGCICMHKHQNVMSFDAEAFPSDWKPFITVQSTKTALLSEEYFKRGNPSAWLWKSLYSVTFTPYSSNNSARTACHWIVRCHRCER